MTIILLEALGALLLFVAAVWWTMFAGRDKGELRRRDDEQENEIDTDAPPQAADDADVPPPGDDPAP